MALLNISTRGKWFGVMEDYVYEDFFRVPPNVQRNTATDWSSRKMSTEEFGVRFKRRDRSGIIPQGGRGTLRDGARSGLARQRGERMTVIVARLR
jgi:hypothetical protein